MSDALAPSGAAPGPGGGDLHAVVGDRLELTVVTDGGTEVVSVDGFTRVPPNPAHRGPAERVGDDGPALCAAHHLDARGCRGAIGPSFVKLIADATFNDGGLRGGRAEHGHAGLGLHPDLGSGRKLYRLLGRLRVPGRRLLGHAPGAAGRARSVDLPHERGSLPGRVERLAGEVRAEVER